jgi:NADH-quinone oxidoreductase subunit M
VHLLSAVTFLPLIGALVVAFTPKKALQPIRFLALAFALATFGLSMLILPAFNSQTFHFQLEERIAWIPQMGISYHVGIDGLSLWLIPLTTFLTSISILFSFYVKHRVKEYMLFMLALETAMLGVFVSLDMIVFYTFFEFSLIPMALLIWIWGGERRNYAALKFFIFTFAGSIFMLVGMIALMLLNRQASIGHQTSFDIIDIQQNVANGRLWAGAMAAQPLIFWSFMIAFLVKTPAFPFHTWLPDAHVEAPTAGSVILAGILLKMGTYGIMRFCLPLFPETLVRQAPIIAWLGIIGILYGAIVAAVQPDWKKLVAYSSVAHMGFVLIGIVSLNEAGLMGASMQQLNHGISTGALFLMVGLIYERRHTRLFKDFGGLKAQMPIYTTLFLIVMLSSVGLPGTNGFIGEFLSLFGFFESGFNHLYGLNVVMAGIAGVGVILAAVYLLYMFQQVFYGANKNPDNQRLKDLKPWEIGMVLTFVLFIFWGGLYPNTFLAPMEASVAATRLMAIDAVGQRPAWSNKAEEINLSDDPMLRGQMTVNQQTLGEPLHPTGQSATLQEAAFQQPVTPGSGSLSPIYKPTGSAPTP